jgi:hypothetical protein
MHIPTLRRRYYVLSHFRQRSEPAQTHISEVVAISQYLGYRYAEVEIVFFDPFP